jgi:hypothetical protein
MKGILLRMLAGMIILVGIGMADLWVRSALWPRVFPLAVVSIVGTVVLGPMLIHGWTGWRSGSEDPDFWQQTPDGYFMEHQRSKWARGPRRNCVSSPEARACSPRPLKSWQPAPIAST